MSTYRIALGTASQSVDLGNASGHTVSSWIVQLTGTIGTGTVTPKGYVLGNPAAGTLLDGTRTSTGALAEANAVAIAYYLGTTGVLTSGGTAWSALGIFRVPCDGMSLVLDYTAAGGSDLVAHCTPVYG